MRQELYLIPPFSNRWGNVRQNGLMILYGQWQANLPVYSME